MKKTLLGIALVLLIGGGGLVYRNSIEQSPRPLSCPVESLTCPDGTKVPHLTLSCNFPACPPPNVTFSDLQLSFALPNGFMPATPDSVAVAAYTAPAAFVSSTGGIRIKRYPIAASSTALATIQATALGGASGLPISPASFTATTLGSHQFTVVTIERFEGQVDVAYYLARATDVVRFDAVDKGVDWTNPALDVAGLPTQVALRQLLTTLQGE